MLKVEVLRQHDGLAVRNVALVFDFNHSFTISCRTIEYADRYSTPIPHVNF
jgi:hypothetical protein